MMAVIVDEEETLACIFDFEPAARVLKLAQRARDARERHAELARERNHPKRVMHVALAGNIQHRFAQALASTINVKQRGEILHPDVCRTVLGTPRQPEANRSGARST